MYSIVIPQLSRWCYAHHSVATTSPYLAITLPCSLFPGLHLSSLWLILQVSTFSPKSEEENKENFLGKKKFFAMFQGRRKPLASIVFKCITMFKAEK